MKLDLHKEMIKVVIASLKSTAKSVLTLEEYEHVTFKYNKTNGNIDIKNLSEESMIRLDKAIDDRTKEKPLTN